MSDIVVFQIPVIKYTGSDPELFNDIKLILEQLHTLNHQYHELWKKNDRVEDLMSSVAYEHSCKILECALNAHMTKGL